MRVYSKTMHGVCSYVYLKISSKMKILGTETTLDPGPDPGPGTRAWGPGPGSRAWGPGPRDPDPGPWNKNDPGPGTRTQDPDSGPRPRVPDLGWSRGVHKRALATHTKKFRLTFWPRFYISGNTLRNQTETKDMEQCSTPFCT